jgi:nicotinamide riboside transporter PnuC
MYAVVPAALILWAWQRKRKFQSQPACESEVAVKPRKKNRLVLWVVSSMIGTACLLGLILSDMNHKVRHVTAAEVQQMVADSKPSRWLLLSCSFILTAGAGFILWWAWRKTGGRQGAAL